MLRATPWSGLWILLALGCASDPAPRSQASPLLGDVMPNFESQTLSGHPLYSGAYEGRTVVVSFVQAECVACERTLSAAQAMYSDRHDVIVVGVFRPEDADGASSMAAKHKLKFPVIVDENGAIAKRFQIRHRPRTFVVSRDGRVRWVGGPNMTRDGLVAAISAAE